MNTTDTFVPAFHDHAFHLLSFPHSIRSLDVYDPSQLKRFITFHLNKLEELHCFQTSRETK